jgi:hypothetical protein
VVIAKLGRQQNASEEAKGMMEAAESKTVWLPGGRERARKRAHFEASELLKSLVLTERDQNMLRVCNLSKKNIENLGEYALGVRHKT